MEGSVVCPRVVGGRWWGVPRGGGGVRVGVPRLAACRCALPRRLSTCLPAAAAARGAWRRAWCGGSSCPVCPRAEDRVSCLRGRKSCCRGCPPRRRLALPCRLALPRRRRVASRCESSSCLACRVVRVGERVVSPRRVVVAVGESKSWGRLPARCLRLQSFSPPGAWGEGGVV